MNINLYLSEKEQAERALAEKLRKEAQLMDRSLSWVVREALEEYFRRKEQSPVPQ